MEGKGQNLDWLAGEGLSKRVSEEVKGAPCRLKREENREAQRTISGKAWRAACLVCCVTKQKELFVSWINQKTKQSKKNASSLHFNLSVESRSEDSKKESIKITIQPANKRRQPLWTIESPRKIGDLDNSYSALCNYESRVKCFCFQPFQLGWRLRAHSTYTSKQLTRVFNWVF